jgi:hypothetical protein
VYKSTAPKIFLKGRGFASDYFPQTTWDSITSADIKYRLREGEETVTDTIRRKSSRWKGNIDRRERPVVYIDLSRILPVSARVGFSKIAKSPHTEASSVPFDAQRLSRFNQIMGRNHESAKMALATVDLTRPIPVLGDQGITYSGFHMGAGQTTILEFIQADIPKYSLVLIDEVETSLHPRAQRRLIRDLAEKCRESELQVILTTHSPFILDELPPEARAQIIQTDVGRTIVYGVSLELAMTKMDDVPQHECDLYVEDKRAQIMLIEILSKHAAELALRCRTIPFGAASVGRALGIMVSQKRFPRPSCVFLDGDQAGSIGCTVLPGDDAPERVVMESLKANEWRGVAARTGRKHADLVDACARAMSLENHHDWISQAATALVLGGDVLWQALCAEWAEYLPVQEAQKILQPIQDTIIGSPWAPPAAPVPIAISTGPTDANGNPTLFELC